MTVSVQVVDHTGLVGDHGAVKDLVQAVLAAEEASGEVGVAFVDVAAIAGLNARYRGLDCPTDVLAFDYGADDSWPAEADRGSAGGEVVVCPQVVVRYAGEEGRDPGRQLGWTLIHGALHLAGYDHETDHGEMREREQRLLEDLDPQVGALTLAPDCG
jgi:probable rRNA maturation factor